MAAVRKPRSTGIKWFDALLEMAYTDPSAGLSPAPGVATVSGGGFVGPSARRLLKAIGWSGAETVPEQIMNRVRLLLGRRQIRPFENPTVELPMLKAREYGLASDTNVPGTIAEYLPETAEHYTNVLNQLLRTRNPVVQDPVQAGAYDLLLMEFLRGGLP